MKVGVLGSGDVAKSWPRLLKHGHQTMVGTRDTAKLAEWQKANPKALLRQL